MPLLEEEKAILVAVELGRRGEWPLQESLFELASLSSTAGAIVVAALSQSRDKPNLKYYIGSGKIEELKALIASKDANLVIFDCELGPSQIRNLEAELEVKVVDRTSLILDIFAQHAHSREGKLQVELAQTNYTLTHLVGKGELMSRLGGGIGTRGPGETKLETDRRVIKSRVAKLKREIEAIREARALKRVARKSALLPLIAIVGYTNAGKSTLLNSLTNAEALVRDKLFATLDPTVRRLGLPSGLEVLVSDTVGFIHKLPHQLVEAFHATLEEVAEADILLHVVDSTSDFMEDQIKAVFRVLEEIKAIAKPIITVFNKTDSPKRKTISRELRSNLKPYVEISALNKEGMESLLRVLEKELESVMIATDFEVPLNRMDMVHLIHEKGRILSEKYDEDKVKIRARVSEVTANRLREYLKFDSRAK
jgi:GTP-binding protein HflX